MSKKCNLDCLNCKLEKCILDRSEDPTKKFVKEKTKMTREEINAKKRRYYYEHKEAHQKYYYDNIEKIKENRKIYYRNNLEKFKKYNHEYYMRYLLKHRVYALINYYNKKSENQ